MRFFARGFVSPWIDIRIGASGRFLPFGFSRQSLARTLAEFFRFLPADVRGRMGFRTRWELMIGKLIDKFGIVHFIRIDSKGIHPHDMFG